ncbi:MAG TPA: YicC/YloC family endoribonuclease [Acidobacteriota bacterium]|nr:YicC/YloC family endoribonuclease [Acidobacteriota bacterium]
MRSMTGYGHARRSLEGMDLELEIRTVNSRYFDFKARLPHQLNVLEASLREQVQRRIHRGRVELSLQALVRTSDQFELNASVVANYLKLASQIQEMSGVEGLRIDALLALPGSVVQKDLLSQVSVSEMEATVHNLASEALEEVIVCRSREGMALQSDLLQRIDGFQTQVEKLSELAGQVEDYYRRKLEERISQFVESGAVDVARLNQEVVYLAEKADVSEELTRLRSHIQQLQLHISSGEKGSVGKSLDFLCQELNREVNTILSKAVVVEVSEIAVAAKGEIERIREQVQNVE